MTTIGPDASAGRRPARQPRGGLGRHQEPSSTRGGNGFFRELPFLILVAFGLALLIKAFIVQAFYIPSGSMEQTLLIKDRVLVNKLVYRFRDIHRGEIVVFNGLDSFSPEVAVAPPGNDVQRILRGLSNSVGLGQPGEKDFIKRVIGVPGDTVACCDQSGRVTVNGVSLNEGYLYEDNMEPFGPVTVAPGRLWVMGDHRSMSADSRAHVSDPNQGTVPANKVIGRAFVRVWPFSRLGLLPVPDTFSQSFRSAARGGPTGQTGPAGRVPVPASVTVVLPDQRWYPRLEGASVGDAANASSGDLRCLWIRQQGRATTAVRSSGRIACRPSRS